MYAFRDETRDLDTFVALAKADPQQDFEGFPLVSMLLADLVDPESWLAPDVDVAKRAMEELVRDLDLELATVVLQERSLLDWAAESHPSKPDRIERSLTMMQWLVDTHHVPTAQGLENLLAASDAVLGFMATLADVEKPDENGVPPLLGCLKCGNPRGALALLRAGADPKSGRPSPLSAARSGQKSCHKHVAMLVETYADDDTRMGARPTPFQQSQQQSRMENLRHWQADAAAYDELVSLLSAKGAPVVRPGWSDAKRMKKVRAEATPAVRDFLEVEHDDLSAVANAFVDSFEDESALEALTAVAAVLPVKSRARTVWKPTQGPHLHHGDLVIEGDLTLGAPRGHG